MVYYTIAKTPAREKVKIMCPVEVEIRFNGADGEPVQINNTKAKNIPQGGRPVAIAVPHTYFTDNQVKAGTWQYLDGGKTTRGFYVYVKIGDEEDTQLLETQGDPRDSLYFYKVFPSLPGYASGGNITVMARWIDQVSEIAPLE
jgi:hypothetical protein